jgi:hypothetical protein
MQNARITTPAGDQPVRTCIIIAGMHRSGTSATARVVNLLGADIAGDLASAAVGINDRGFWESPAIFGIHDELMHTLDSSWDDPFPLADRWLETGAARQAKRLIVERLAKDFADSRLFVVKDPRLGRLLPLWLEILDELAIEPIVVIPFRNPLEVAASLEKRDRLPVAQSILLYIQSNLEAEHASRGRTRLFHPYDALVSDWRGFADKLAEVGGPSREALSAETISQIDGFLTGELHRHKFSRSDLAASAHAPATIVEMYDRMVEAAATGNDDALHGAFDGIWANMREATISWRGRVAAQVEGLRREFALLGEELKAELRLRDAELEQLRAQLRQRDAGLEVLSAELRRHGGELADLRAELRTVRTELIEAEHAHTQTREAYAGLLRSTSWRITAPLRAVKRVTSRLLF